MVCALNYRKLVLLGYVVKYTFLNKLVIKNPQLKQFKIVDKVVDNVDNYFLSIFSPTVTMFPAPIVINISPLVQLLTKKSSISSNVWKK